MWILSCDGDLLGGARKWLRPGSAHLFGRTSGKAAEGQRNQYIEHKTVSRKHCLLTISEVKAGDSAHLHTRSQITVEDNSKLGTTVNGEKILKEAKLLDGKEYSIQLASYPQLFRLMWQPVTLSFVNLPKKAKAKEETLAARRERLEQADVKVVTDYVFNESTHVLAQRRNNPTALQGLVQARWIVDWPFADALAEVVQRPGVDDSGAVQPSPLEVDFDAHWPKEDEFITPAGTEPVQRGNEFLKPKPERAEVFSGYNFIFLSESQHETIMPVVTSGGGKALLTDVQLGDTTVEEVAKYVLELAGRKGNDTDFRLSQQTGAGGVVVVRLNESSETAREFQRNLDLALDQRSVVQSEFLDAILMNDASVLRQSLQPEPDNAGRSGEINARASPLQSPPRPQQHASAARETSAAAEQAPPLRTQEQPAETTQQPTSTAPRKRQRRIITQSRFKGFDDFDPSQFTRPGSESPEPSHNIQGSNQGTSMQSMDVDEGPQRARTQQSSRKRPAPVNEEEDEEDLMDGILPAQAKMKRMRIMAAQRADRTTLEESLQADRAAPEKAATAKARAKQKKEKQIDVLAEIAARRVKEEQERRADEEVLRQQFEGVDISELRNLAKVEEMEIKPREPPARRADEEGRSERWNDAWNGRKNFKKFRPQGSARDGPRARKVIVTLEEVPRKGHGIGDEYWLNTSTSSSRGKSKSQSQSQTLRQGTGSDDGENAARFRRRLQRSRLEDAENPDNEPTLREEIAGDMREANLAGLNRAPSQTLGAESQRAAAGKRPASAQGGNAPKKARQSGPAGFTRETINVDDDDDDGLKFRRRRR